ncbi:MAG: 1-deoxy-D-xylulose-5-phosphate synthase [Kineosporiaceae bacterium]|nr:1-deoxy-D-xylulose-5-phosphate synthase [Kineosporiaceae bacterium]
MVQLASIGGPEDLQPLRPEDLDDLATQIRTFLVEQVSRTGGHLGPNLGVVELTLALHRVFASPTDRIVFDTGHQAYVHKLLTGRHDFSGLRQEGGLSGYPSRAESPHDIVENSHASTALSWADGIAKAHQLRGEDRHVVAVIGDGALTGGMAWEALNNIAAGPDRRLVIVVNDNGRSYAPTIGGLAHHLSTLRTTRGYERFLDWGKGVLQRRGAPGRLAYEALHGVKKGLKDVVAPQGMFEDLGIKYLGPVDGHDIAELEHVLRRAREYGGPVIVHVLTRKGHGYAPAENDSADHFHAVGVVDPETGQPLAASGTGWTSVFSDAVVELADEHPELVGITAAMMIPVGLHRFAAKHPERVFDVGIAEQHAATSAAGMAFAGLHPVVAVYATFLNRAFDQVLMDCALHRAGVTFVLDRAGVTGDDGASHNGMWDMSMLAMVPGLRLAAPRDGATLCAELAEAVAITDGPTVLRFPKGAVPADIPAIDTLGGAAGSSGGSGPGAVDVLYREGPSDVLLVAVGAMVGTALDVAARLTARGIGAQVIDPRWVLPVPDAVLDLAAGHRLVVVIEDNLVRGGVGSVVREHLAGRRIDVPVRTFGIPSTFLDHAGRASVLDQIGLTAVTISDEVIQDITPRAADVSAFRPRAG